jgi:hypothetical protein
MENNKENAPCIDTTNVFKSLNISNLLNAHIQIVNKMGSQQQQEQKSDLSVDVYVCSVCVFSVST